MTADRPGAIEVRPFHSRDLRSVLRLLRRALFRDPIPEARFTRQVLLDPNFRTEGAPAALVDGSVAGFCLSVARSVPLENAPPDDDRGYVTLLAVDPRHRRRGIGTRLMDHAEAYLRERGRRTYLLSPYSPGYFIPGVDVEAYDGAIPFLLGRGYREVFRPLAMEAPLWDPPGDPPASESAAHDSLCEPYRPELTLPLLAFTAAEFPGDWVRVVREAAARIVSGDPAGRLMVLHRAGQVIGFSHYENERFGPIGVAAAERGKGHGRRLMAATLSAMRDAGFRRAWFLWTDDVTARRVYEGAGFRETRRFAVFRKDL